MYKDDNHSNQWLRSVGDTNQNTHKKWTNITVTSTVNLIQVYKGTIFILASEPAKDVK